LTIAIVKQKAGHLRGTAFLISPLLHDSWPVSHLYRNGGKNKAALITGRLFFPLLRQRGISANGIGVAKVAEGDLDEA